MAVSDTGRPAANSNLLLTSDSDNQRNIGVELSMRERFERELTLINFFNTRAQQYTGARSFRTPRNLTAVTTTKNWDGSAAATPTQDGSFELTRLPGRRPAGLRPAHRRTKTMSKG